MYKFSKSSLKKLETCDARLHVLFSNVIKHADCTILEGYRSPAKQRKLLAEGKSKLKLSKHNQKPSKAIDVAPYPIIWNDIERYHTFAKLVFEQAKLFGIKIRWGGDWDMDGDTTDQTFNDLVHFELID